MTFKHQTSVLLTLFLLMISIMLHAQSWTQIGSDIDGEAASDNSGQSVSLSSDGSTVAIGGRYNEVLSH